MPTATARPLSELKGRSETAEVQAILRSLLIEKARDPDGPVYDELEKHRRQTEPLLIQYDGTVLNGNRRLAAMRELLGRDEAHYGRFSTVQVAVLPADLQQNELEFIEAALQMAPDLKLDYSWINRRLKLRQHVRDMSPRQSPRPTALPMLRDRHRTIRTDAGRGLSGLDRPAPTLCSGRGPRGGFCPAPPTAGAYQERSGRGFVAPDWLCQ